MHNLHNSVNLYFVLFLVGLVLQVLIELLNIGIGLGIFVRQSYIRSKADLFQHWRILVKLWCSFMSSKRSVLGVLIELHIMIYELSVERLEWMI